MEAAMQLSNRNLRRFSCVSLFATVLLSGPAIAETALQMQPHQTAPQQINNAHIPRIQLAILLDTSNSMDGLIDQTRNQLWQIVNEFSAAKKNGVTPILEIALFEYGNSNLSEETGYIRMLSGFTRELDQVSEGLFSLTTNGGAEYCGYVMQDAITKLQWSHSDRDIKSIFIAGNESFAQGPVNYRQVAKLARQRGITINTIHAGGHQVGISDNWQSGALLADGSYMSIDSNQKIVHIAAPQDKRIAELNGQLNTTYIPYGAEGNDKIRRQMEQDAESNKISAGLLAKRAKTKSSSYYNNSSWDLVDALKEGKMKETELADMEEKHLPKPMHGLSDKEKIAYAKAKTEERNEIKKQIDELSKARAAYVAKVKREQAAATPSVGDALSEAIKKQAENKNFDLQE
jgi:G:T/U-mismatch repair DNA glycosylase